MAAIIAEAASTLRCNPMDLDSELALRHTTNVQLGLVIAGVAYAAYLRSLDFPVSLVAGHSVGAFSAAIAAGVLGFAGGLRLVQVRAAHMEQMAEKGYGMLAIRGLSCTRVSELQAEQVPETYLAAINRPKQVVVSGPIATLQHLTRAALTAGAAAASFLTIPVPAHCPLMAHTQAAVDNAFNDVPLALPKATYLCSSTARAARNALRVRTDLVQGLTQPVLWYETCLIIAEHGATLLLEGPPGSVLTGLSKTSLPHVCSISAEDLLTSSPEIYRRLAVGASEAR